MHVLYLSVMTGMGMGMVKEKEMEMEMEMGMGIGMEMEMGMMLEMVASIPDIWTELSRGRVIG